MAKKIRKSPFYIPAVERPVVHGPKRRAKMTAERPQKPLAS